MNDEIELGEGIDPRSCVAEHRHLVARTLDPDVRLVRLAGEYGVQDGGDVAVHPAAETLVLDIAETVLYVLVGLELIGGFAHEAGGENGRFSRARERVRRRARLVDIAHHAVERGDADGRLRGLRILVGRHAEGDAARFAVRVELDALFQIGLVYMADGGYLLERVFGGLVLVRLEGRLALDGGAVLESDLVGAEQGGGVRRLVVRRKREGLRGVSRCGVVVDVALVFLGDVVEHAARAQQGACRIVGVDEEGEVRPLRTELLVVKVVFDDVANPAEHHGDVGAGANGQPNVGTRRIGRETGVDDDGLRARSAQLDDGAACRRGRVSRRSRAPHDVSVDGDGGVVQLRAARVGDGGVARAVYERHGEVARQIALSAAGLEHVARAPEVAEPRGAEELRGSAAAGGAQETFEARLLLHLHKRIGDGVDRLFPRNALPLVSAAFPNALHGVLVAVRMVERLNAGQPFRAYAAFGHGVGGIAFKFDDASVLDVRDYAAVGDACTARSVHELDFIRSVGLLGMNEIVHRRSSCYGCCRRGERCCLGEAAARHVFRCHLPFLSVSFVVFRCSMSTEEAFLGVDLIGSTGFPA